MVSKFEMNGQVWTGGELGGRVVQTEEFGMGKTTGSLAGMRSRRDAENARDREQRKPQSLGDSFDNGPTHALCGLNDNHHTDREAGLLGLGPGFLTDTAVWPSA